MSDYHILTGSGDGNSYQVVHHIPIPDANNRVGVNYRTALINSGIGGSTVLEEGVGPGQISAVEHAEIVAGSLFEFSEQFSTNPGENAAGIRDRIDARHAEIVSQVQSDLQGRLSYFGYTRDVP